MSNPRDSEAILFEFAVEKTHDRATLERYLREYPELAEELIDLSSQIRFAKRAVNPCRVPDPGLDAAWDVFLACGTKPVALVVAENPFANFKGVGFVRLAAALNVPRAFLTAFRDGLVAAESIPEPFLRRFAEAANVTFDVARHHFAQAEPVLSELAFKSDVKPSYQGRMTFRELILATEMTVAQRQLLLGDCDSDGRD